MSLPSKSPDRDQRYGRSGPVLQTFATDRALGGEFHLEVVRGHGRLGNGGENLDWSSARKQAILADRLYGAVKVGIDDTMIENLHKQLRELNPHAAIDEANRRRPRSEASDEGGRRRR